MWTTWLQLIAVEAEFDHAFALLEKRWKKREGEALTWFLKFWGTARKRRWFVGSTAPGLPNTNNSLESRNR